MAQGCKPKHTCSALLRFFCFFGCSSCFSLHVMTSHYTLSSIPYLFCIAFSPLFCVSFSFYSERA
jgi:hypothetical protein